MSVVAEGNESVTLKYGGVDLSSTGFCLFEARNARFINGNPITTPSLDCPSRSIDPSARFESGIMAESCRKFQQTGEVKRPNDAASIKYSPGSDKKRGGRRHSAPRQALSRSASL